MPAQPHKQAPKPRRAAAKLAPCAFVFREQREQLERNDGRALEEKFDNRRVRQRMARQRLEILQLLLKRFAAEPVERRVRDDGPETPIDFKGPNRTGARNAVRSAADQGRPCGLDEAENVSGRCRFCVHGSWCWVRLEKRRARVSRRHLEP